MTLKFYSDIYPPTTTPEMEGLHLVAIEKRDCEIGKGLFLWWGGGAWRREQFSSPVTCQCWYWRGLAFDPDAAEQGELDSVSVSSQCIVTRYGVFIPGAEVES